jgi:hypothetical protein
VADVDMGNQVLAMFPHNHQRKQMEWRVEMKMLMNGKILQLSWMSKQEHCHREIHITCKPHF